jgi:O-methyltransferase
MKKQHPFTITVSEGRSLKNLQIDALSLLNCDTVDHAAMKLLDRSPEMFQRIASKLRMDEVVTGPLKEQGFEFLKYEYQDRDILYRKVAEECNFDEILFYEFGVFEGESIKKWSQINKNKNSLFFGFDSFEGLPEAWLGTDKEAGYFNVGGNLPKIDDDRVSFVKGWFQDSVPGFLDSHFSQTAWKGRQKVLHLDADLYSSTLYILAKFDPFIEKGDVLIFDEFATPAKDEFQAFYDYYRSFNRKWKVIASRIKCNKIAVRITE